MFSREIRIWGGRIRERIEEKGGERRNGMAIGKNEFEEIGTKIAGGLKDYQKELNEAYLKTDEKKGLTISASININPDQDGYRTDITMKFVKEQIVIKSSFVSSHQLRLPLKSRKGPVWTDDDLRTYWHCRYMAYGDYSLGFEAYRRAKEPHMIFKEGSYYRGDKLMNYKPVTS